ncbi:MAG: rRNA maturation RNase YbeY [Lachnospiraceae bacterium]|nr:rRNA maturation RNase YbeY [Lachnospiraceae bacterium]
MSIYIENELSTEIPKEYEVIVEDIINASIDYMKCPYECEVNVFFTDNDGIKEINNMHRGIDAPTDVLSFPMCEFVNIGDFYNLEDNPIDYFNQDTGELILGDIILNIDRIVSQAQEYGHTKRRETAFLTAHSMLHLFGYDHIDDEERIIMEEKQEEILTKKGYTRDDKKEIH